MRLVVAATRTLFDLGQPLVTAPEEHVGSTVRLPRTQAGSRDSGPQGAVGRKITTRREADKTMDPEADEPVGSAQDRARQNAEHLADILRRAADTLEQSATLAEQHAQRRRQAGQPAGAASEQLTAERAREAAQRARSRADDLARRARDSPGNT